MQQTKGQSNAAYNTIDAGGSTGQRMNKRDVPGQLRPLDKINIDDMSQATTKNTKKRELHLLKKQSSEVELQSQTIVNRIAKMDNEQSRILKKIENTRQQAQKISAIAEYNEERARLMQELNEQE